jgi:hypothetical protein
MSALFCAGFLIARTESTRTDEAPVERTRSWQVLLCCGVLVSAFWAELAVIRRAAETQQPFPAWFSKLPLLLIDENPPLNGHTPPWVGNDLALLAVVQSVALYALYRTLRHRKATSGSLAIIATSFGMMLFGALSTHAAAAGIDLYLDAGYGRLGLDAYRPPSQPFRGEFALINHLWGTPILPAVYGPLWLLVASSVVNSVHTLAGQLLAFRILGALSLLACLGLLRTMRAPAAILGLFAVNPVLIAQYVADGHNDALPLVLSLCAVAIARRSPLIALFCAVAAGAMKLPFALASALAFSQLDNRNRRLTFALATLLLSAVITVFLSHGAYLSALRYPLTYQDLPAFRDRFAHALAIAGALIATVLAIVSRRFVVTGAWPFLSLGAVVLPWYVAWGLPYAILEETFLPVYLFTLPVLAFDLSTTFGITPTARLLFVIVICTPLMLLISRLRTRTVAT